MAVWTTITYVRTTSSRSLPLVVRPFRASPPEFLARSCYHLVRREIPVLRRMPLGGDVWEACSKGVGNRSLLLSAVRATATDASTVTDNCLPFVVRSLKTAPPHLFARPSYHLLRSEILVLCRIPLSGGELCGDGQPTDRRGGPLGDGWSPQRPPQVNLPGRIRAQRHEA